MSVLPLYRCFYKVTDAVQGVLYRAFGRRAYRSEHRMPGYMGALSLNIAWTISKVALLTTAIIGGASFFSGLYVLQATLAFWTVEGLEVANTMTDGGVETAKYPISIYKSWLRDFFTFVVPLAFVNYYPSLAILDRPEGYLLLNWIAPVIGVLFLVVSLHVWKLGVRHYCSTGS